MKIYENLDLQDLENEIWKIIENYPDYKISNLGRIKSFKKWHGTNERILKQCKNDIDIESGYFQVNLYKDGKSKPKLIHILEFENFNNYKLKENECVHHIDLNPENNNLNNFQLKTKSEHNSLHNKGKIFSGEHRKKISETRKKKFKSGEFNHKKENNPNFKIINQRIIDIKSDIEKEILTQRHMAKKHGVSQITISRIKTGKIDLI